MGSVLGYAGKQVLIEMQDNKDVAVTGSKAERVRMPSISYIVARSYPDCVIGNNNKLPWRLATDLKNFRKITSGHVIVMGRRTHDSIGKLLPNRVNIVMTRDESISNRPAIDFDIHTQRIFTRTLEETLFFADVISICRGKKDVFIIGGQHMYELFGQFVNKVYLTEVYTGPISGDAVFDMKFDRDVWKTVSEESVVKKEGVDDYGFLFSVLERRDRRSRYAFVRQFMTDIESKEEWLKNNINKHKREFDQYLHENLELAV